MSKNECDNINDSTYSPVPMTFCFSKPNIKFPCQNPSRNSQHSDLIRFFSIPLFGLLQIFGIGHAFADDQDVINQHVFNLEAGISLLQDNNIFRLPNSVNPLSLGLPLNKRSDTERSEYAGLVLDQPIGLQQFHLEAIVDENNYRNYSYLNGRTTNYNGYWQLVFTPEFRGKLSSNRTQSAAGFAYYQTYNSRNIITNENTGLNLDWSPLGNWHLTSNFSDIVYISSVNSTSIQSFDSKIIEVGINYDFPSSTNLSLVHDKTIGTIKSQILDPVHQLDTGYQENVYKATLNWPITGKSIINAQVGYDDRHYDHYATRNYSGSTGNFSYAQDVTSEINLSANAGRTYSAYVDNNESYYINDTKTLLALWQSTSKISLKARLDSYRHDYLQPIPGITVLTPRLDRGLTHTIEIDWAPLSTITVVGSVVRDQRESTIVIWDYNDTSINLSINAKF